MNHSGDVAEQIVGMTLNGSEVVLKVTGTAAKHVAAFVFAILSDQKKTKGKAFLNTMLRDGKEIDVFSIRSKDYETFTQEAKKYGILYCPVSENKNFKDGRVDILVRKEDAARLNHIVERFNFADVSEIAKVKKEIEKKRDNVPDIDVQDEDEIDKMVDEMFEAPIKKEGAEQVNPSVAKTEKSPPSEPSSETQKKQGTSDRKSVRKEIQEIRLEQKSKGQNTKQAEQSLLTPVTPNKPVSKSKPKER